MVAGGGEEGACKLCIRYYYYVKKRKKIRAINVYTRNDIILKLFKKCTPTVESRRPARCVGTGGKIVYIINDFCRGFVRPGVSV